jgi:hypothetical protein
MSACRARRFGGAFGLAAAVLTVLAGAPVLAQPPVAADTPVAVDPQAPGPAGGEPSPLSVSPAARGVVESRGPVVDRQELAAPQAESVGLLAPDQGGLSVALWAGTPANVVRTLLPRLTSGGESPAWRGLARRLLLIAAPAPKDTGIGDQPSLAELRVIRVMALGFADDSMALAESTPTSLAGPGLQRARTEARLLSGHLDTLCPSLSGLEGADLSKAQVLCHLVGGNTFGGGLGLDLLRDQKPADAPFIAAAESLAGLPLGKAGLGPVRDPSPLQFAAIRAAKMPLPAEMVASARPAMLRTLALSADLPMDQRLNIAERAEAMGLLSPEEFAKLLAEIPFQPEELAAPLAHLDGMAGPRALALLLRVAETADPVLRMPLLLRALDLAAGRGRFPTAARLALPQLTRLLPQPDQASVAPIMVRALLVGGRRDAAMSWLDLAGHDGGNGLVKLWPLVRAWGMGDASSTAWRETADPRRAALVATLLAGLGQPVAEGDWPLLLEAPRSAAGPGPGIGLLIQAAARDHLQGAAVLAALAVFAEPDKTDPFLLSQALSTLVAVGLDKDARRLAVDVMLAAGL